MGQRDLFWNYLYLIRSCEKNVNINVQWTWFLNFISSYAEENAGTGASSSDTLDFYTPDTNLRLVNGYFIIKIALMLSFREAVLCLSLGTKA